jgi:hypothetical protein
MSMGIDTAVADTVRAPSFGAEVPLRKRGDDFTRFATFIATYFARRRTALSPGGSNAQSVAKKTTPMPKMWDTNGAIVGL